MTDRTMSRTADAPFMSTVVPSNNAPSLPTTLLGYEVVERIGSGGYGEVWKVRVPGGILKALKIVHGQNDGERAVRELKAFNRVKEVRHPFVLSIERIEMTDGKLCILTELADRSLKQRYDECVQQGLRGIPRDELLGYLRDTADALDHIRTVHGLQHLDVKPENLLLVGGHVKVADFGLVRALDEFAITSQHALTPLYAPPEVFDGHPHSNSDQYSLALVYHEMLTGSLPFIGRTTAQLAAQHIYGRPMLTMLPFTDQAVIARALMKLPAQRFASCRDLIDNLVTSTQSSLPRGETNSPNSSTIEQGLRSTVQLAPQTVQDPEHPLTGASNRVSQTRARIRPSTTPGESRATNLPPVAIDPSRDIYRPTLFIGVGGLGATMLQHLKRRLADRMGPRADVPAIQMLLIDTNAKSVYNALHGDEVSSLSPREVLHLPINSSSEYRDDARDLLRWLNRRWLYNIPRSLNTEGMRPLGRLAYSVHAADIWQTIRAALLAACDANALDKSTAVTGLEFKNQAPRVYLVASSSGGSGSGMAIDLAVGLRRILADLGWSDENLQLILAHTSDRRSTTTPVALANSSACIRELFHFIRFGFSDTTPSSLPAMSIGVGPLTVPNTYLVHLGEELDDAQFDRRVEMLSEYCYRSSLTEAAGFFDACRSAITTDRDSFEPVVRSFSLRTIARSRLDVPASALNALCQTFVDSWRGVSDAIKNFGPPTTTETVIIRGDLAPKQTSKVQMREVAEPYAKSLSLSVDGVRDMVRGLIGRVTSENGLEWLYRQLIAKPPETFPSSAIELLELPLTALNSRIEPNVACLAAALNQALEDWITNILENHPARVSAGQSAIEWITEHTRQIKRSLTQELKEIESQVGQLIERLEQIPARSIPDLLRTVDTHSTKMAPDRECLHVFCERLIESISLRNALRLISAVAAQVTKLGSQLLDLNCDLELIAKSFTLKSDDPHGERLIKPWYESCPDVAWRLSRVVSQLLAEMERSVEAELFDGNKSLRRTIVWDSDTRGKLVSAIRAAAHGAVRKMQKQDLVTKGQQAERLEIAEPLRIAAREALPAWSECGGGLRSLLVLPKQDVSLDECEQILGRTCNVIQDDDDDPVVFYELENIPLRDIGNKFADAHPDVVQLADRLLTRTDINWCNLS